MLGNKEIMGKNIKRHMKMNNVSRTQMSKALGVSYSTLSDWINAKMYPRIDKIEMMADYFGVNKSALVEDVKEFSTIQAMPAPVLSQISAGEPLYAEENIIEYAQIPAFLYKENVDQFYLKVSGDSMDKEFKEGDLVLVEKDTPVETGQIGVVFINGYNATVKRIRYDENKIILYPESNNPEHIPQIFNDKDEVTIVGKVISSQKFY